MFSGSLARSRHRWSPGGPLTLVYLPQIRNLRLREAEQQRLREVELERQRQAEGRERLRGLNAIQEEILQLNHLLEPASKPTQPGPAPDHVPYITRGNQLCTQVSEVVRATSEVCVSLSSLDDDRVCSWCTALS